MERTVSIPDGTASHVNRFAAENDISIDRAHELLLTIGIETLEGVDLEVSVEDDRLILDCPACGALFDAADEAVEHACSDP